MRHFKMYIEIIAIDSVSVLAWYQCNDNLRKKDLRKKDSILKRVHWNNVWLSVVGTFTRAAIETDIEHN